MGGNVHQVIGNLDLDFKSQVEATVIGQNANRGKDKKPENEASKNARIWGTKRKNK